MRTVNRQSKLKCEHKPPSMNMHQSAIWQPSSPSSKPNQWVVMAAPAWGLLAEEENWRRINSESTTKINDEKIEALRIGVEEPEAERTK